MSQLQHAKMESREICENVYELRFVMEDIVVSYELVDGVATLESIEGKYRPWLHQETLQEIEDEVGTLLDVERVVAHH